MNARSTQRGLAGPSFLSGPEFRGIHTVGLPCPALPAPVQSESLTIPGGDGPRLHDLHGRAPALPQPRQLYPKDTIGGPQAKPAATGRTFEHQKLMAQGGELGLQGSAGTQRASKKEEPPPANISGNETILLVEDDPGVRQLAQMILTSAGYAVLIAENAAQAISLCETRSEPVHLLLTDVVMPGMGGCELAGEVTVRKPGVKVLYMSGYAVNAIVHHGVLDADTSFLAKPLTPALLLLKVREVLDRSR